MGNWYDVRRGRARDLKATIKTKYVLSGVTVVEKILISANPENLGCVLTHAFSSFALTPRLTGASVASVRVEAVVRHSGGMVRRHG
jgi:hypothetical protein